jgi:hypothetical protein
MRRVLGRLALVVAALLPLPVVIGVTATNAYAGRIVKDGTGCFEFGVPGLPVPPVPLGSSPCQITLVLDALARVDVRVAVRTVDGTAVAGEDYVTIDAIVTIPAGGREADVRLEIVADEVEERDESFTVTFEVLDPGLAERIDTEVTILDGGPEGR